MIARSIIFLLNLIHATNLETIKSKISFEKTTVTKTDREDLARNKYIQKRFANIPSPQTRETYGKLFIRFLRSVHLTVDDLIELRKQTDITQGHYPVEELIDYRKVKAKENGKKVYLRRNVINAVESFFKWNRLSLEVIKKPVYSPKAREEIKKEDVSLLSGRVLDQE